MKNVSLSGNFERLPICEKFPYEFVTKCTKIWHEKNNCNEDIFHVQSINQSSACLNMTTHVFLKSSDKVLFGECLRNIGKNMENEAPNILKCIEKGITTYRH